MLLSKTELLSAQSGVVGLLCRLFGCKCMSYGINTSNAYMHWDKITGLSPPCDIIDGHPQGVLGYLME